MKYYENYFGFGECLSLNYNDDILSIPNIYNKPNVLIRVEIDYSTKLPTKNEVFDFLNLLSVHLSQISNLSITNYFDGEATFLYNFKNLKTLILRFYNDVSCSVDFQKIALLSELRMNWYPKMIKNLEYQKELSLLSLSDFTEKDFKNIPKLERLKAFRTIGGKLRSLDYIENISNVIKMEISDHKSLSDISLIKKVEKLKFIEFNYCWKLADFSPLSSCNDLEVIRIIDCKNLESIKFVKDLPKLKCLSTLGTTKINDYDTTPAEHVEVFFGSDYNKYNKKYLHKQKLDNGYVWSNY